MSKITSEVEIDFGNLDAEEAKAVLKELIETMPDKHIAEVILECGTQELADNLREWVEDLPPEEDEDREEAEEAFITNEELKPGD